MSQLIHHRHITDTRTPLSVTLKQRNSAGTLTVVDLTGFLDPPDLEPTPLVVKFKMVDADGTVVIAETDVGVTIDDAAAGEVSYDFSSSEVTTGGTYYGYFVVYTWQSSTEFDHFPVEHHQLKIVLSAD